MDRRTGFVIAVSVISLIPVMAFAAPVCTPAAPNLIKDENQKDGSPRSEWDLDNNCQIGDRGCLDGPSHIQGFASEISVNRGESVAFKVRIEGATNPAFQLDIYRMGHYGGDGARKIVTINAQQTGPQPACTFDSATGLVDCDNWSVNATWNGKEGEIWVPSGIYFAKLTSEAVTGESHIFFIIRDDASCSDLLFQTSDTTWQAYNSFSDGRGRINFYYRDDNGQPAGASERRAYKLSYARPFNVRGLEESSGGPHSWVFNAEYPMVRWLEANGYDVSYTTGVDSDRRGAELLEHKVFLSVGHDEYWSAGQRTNVEAARDAGVHLAFFSGNEIYWKTRWEGSHRTLVTYKESFRDATDPDSAWTGTWRDPAGGPPLDGKPENALLGSLFTTNNLIPWVPGTLFTPPVKVSQEDGLLRFWRNTAASTQASGNVLSLATGTLGYEYDTDLDNGFRPAGLIRLATTTLASEFAANAIRLSDPLGPGVSYTMGADPHHMTLYRHFSGALVFSAGTIQWSWGLDCQHDRGDDCVLYNASASEREKFATMRQATVNLFADMGVQPKSLQPSLALATASTDVTAPVSAITAPAAGASLARDYVVTITGTASDAGGLVAGVEVSFDGGATWHPASGRAAWSYDWIPTQTGTAQIRSRAIDDSGNLETASGGRTVNIVVGTRAPGAALAVPGIIQAEDFDVGPEGVAYHDLTPTVNSGGAYRTTGVDITQCASSCGRIVDYAEAGEWLAYTIDVAATGIYDIVVYGTDGSTGGIFHIEVDGVDKTGDMTVADTGDIWIAEPTYRAGVSLTAGTHLLKIVMDQNAAHYWMGNFDYLRISRAYNATAFAIPGAFEAEDFNEGGEGVAYHDLTSGNSGGAYRTTDVDVSACPAGTQCNHVVGYVVAGEWLEYSINVATTGTYTIAVHAANDISGGEFSVDIDGVDVSGVLSVANTGSGWTAGPTSKSGVPLTAGPHVLRIRMVTAGGYGWVGNFDFVRISRSYNATAFAIPGSFEAEDFNEGGEGVAYHDLTAVNSGGAYRSTGVDITACPAGTQCEYIVGYAQPGEWLEYSIDVATTGTYTITVHGTNGSTGGEFRIDVDGVDVTGALAVADTGDNWIVGTSVKSGVALTAGPHVLRIRMVGAAAHGWLGNFDKVTIASP